MSVDTYFCFCCLSTTELSNLFNNKTDINYANMLKELLHIKASQEEYEDDGYICQECVSRLTDVQKFKSQVLETLNVLQVNGLIKIRKTKGDHYVIKKVPNDYMSEIEEKYTSDNINKSEVIVEEIEQDIKQYQTEIKTIKQEHIEQNSAENIQTSNSDKRTEERTVQKSQPEIIELEKEKCIIVKRKRKGQVESTKREPQYRVTEDFKCELCAVTLPNKYVYHSHMNQHFPNHICETCGKGFLTERRLKRHMPSHKKGPFKCQSCDAEFTNYNTLSSHRQRKHGTSQLYACPHCPERFGTFTRRAHHLAAAHARPAAQYVCRVCDKHFLLAGNLSTHMRNKHLRIKRHFCSECGAGFFYRQELRDHAAVHTGRNPYRCELCPKRYSRKNALEVHMRMHRNDKRFACDTCGKRFIQKCTLRSHLSMHNRKDSKNARTKAKEIVCVQEIASEQILVNSEIGCEQTIVNSEHYVNKEID